MRLIDADELTMQMIANFQQAMWGGADSDECQLALDTIGEAPTVDAVEVTRCKDCRHFVQGEPYDPCECMKWKVKFGVAYTEPDGYCHKAERKDSDGQRKAE